MTLLNAAWMPECTMRRVICHWTGGAYRASGLDRQHYHLLIEGDGNIVRGDRSIADNVRTTGGPYAAHTRACNQFSIGVAVCCMARAQERPFRPGLAPMTELQFERMAELVAELCLRYRIPVTPKTVLGHGEVQTNLGIAQSGKWDPLVLPWKPTMPKADVARHFRALVQSAIQVREEPELAQR
jgi:N-acetyl-anhydromuramyl-L-alanine amidase AmpD